ncbi:MAG: flavodoxin [Methanobrevibacter sp.]|uniref:Flavodoxin n=1 Tax=Methanobrevibacter millerae TaxID=230361 RepID=A0A8T3VPS5_9EURY|nr:flavodoxin family protein [Methanobrevibacter sp.]MBE6509975.1 flavodoxin [Methanobrevibacter millerae]MBO5151559.1 flavodoxin [Methanobrevibacter sp.]
MKVAIRYYTKTGNTKKLAEALSSAIGVEALTVDSPLTEDVDILFLGSAVYAAGVDSKIKEFIQNINVNVGKIVNFSSAALIESTYKQVKKIAEDNNITMAEEEFHCRGAFKFVHRGHPNDEDINNLVNFGKKIVAP